MKLQILFKHLDTWQKEEEMLEALHDWADDNCYIHPSGFSMSKFKNGQRYTFKMEEGDIEFSYDTYDKRPYKVIYSSTHENSKKAISWEVLLSYFTEAKKYLVKDK